jgi:hypothetical protein
MYFGYRAHREHGLGWKAPRSGKQMQDDPGYALYWHHLKTEAQVNGEIRRLIDLCQERGYGPREIVDAFDKDAMVQSPNSGVGRRLSSAQAADGH